MTSFLKPFTALVLAMMLFLLCFIDQDIGYFEDPLRGTTQIEKSLEKPKVILLWNSFFKAPDYNFGFGQKFIYHKCEITNCFLTNNRSLMPLGHYDAIIFHAPRLTSIPVNVSRSAYQRYVFFSLESPPHVNTSLYYNGFYNWTISYRTDSDIVYPYGKFFEIKKDQKSSSEKALDFGRKNTFDFGRKQKWVAWFVSNCKTESRREKYVKALSRFIPVHIYGACGNYSCERFAKNDSCYRMVEDEYRFYLSFENSICKDYVTEKVFKVMKYNIVPVVLGGANYSQLMPSNSFINAMDYTPKELAKLLRYIGNDEKEYRKYLRWKENYNVVSRNDKESVYGRHPFCDLCKKLNTDSLPKTYPDFNSWWRDGKCFSSPSF